MANPDGANAGARDHSPDSGLDPWRFHLTSSIDDQPAEIWDHLTGGKSVFLQRRFLGAVERSGPENLRFRYALGFRGGRPLLALATQRIELSSAQLSCMFGPAKGLRPRSHLRLVRPGGETPGPRRQTPLSLLPQGGLRFLVCGSALSCGLPGVAFDDAEDPSAMWKATLEALRRIRELEGLSGATDISLIKDVPPEDAPAGQALDAARYMAIANEPNMVLRLDPSWRTHEDYLSSMTSRYRRSCRRVLRRVS